MPVLVKLRLDIVWPLVDLEHDDWDYERDAVEAGRDPAVDGVLIIQILNVSVTVIVLNRPLFLINRQIVGQSWRPHLEEYTEQCLQLHKASF